MSIDTLATPGKIAGSLPPMHGTGWAREDVWIEHNSQLGVGDYAVGMGASTRYTYTLPCGTRRLCMDDIYYVEPCPEDDPAGAEAAEFTVLNRYEVREERQEGPFGEWHEVRELETEYDYGSALAWHTLASAEEEVRSLALADLRFCLYANPSFSGC